MNDTKKHPGLVDAQKQACEMFTAIRALESVRRKARDVGDVLIVYRTSRAISLLRDTADIIINREHDPHAERSPYAPADDAVEAE